MSQLKTKKVGGTNIATPLQTIDYSYNIRGWMTKINDPANLGSDIFGYKINYNHREGLENPNTDFMDLLVKPKYNGNIAEVSWKTQTEDNEPLKTYGYVYDGLNRLSAGFYQKAGYETSKEFFEKTEYDLNGNITRLRRSEGLPNGSTTAMAIDNLRYDYEGNKLTKVTEEQIGNSKGYPYLAAHNTITYDNNGNMISHKDKSIASIQYNFLNLPDKIANTPGKFTRVTDYLYRADGVKVSKRYSQGANYKITDYLDGFQYEIVPSGLSGSELKFVPTSEGYFDFINNVYIYNYTDHLGNVRLSYSDANHDGVIQPRDMNVRECTDIGDGNMACTDVWKPGEIVEINNYYPFGLLHNYTATTLNAYQMKYNGKELQETGMYDYGARFYIPDIGRWGVVDPLAEKMRRHSVYNYVFNNPINFIDSDGREPKDDYRVNLNGRLDLIRKTNDKFDRYFNEDGSKSIRVNKEFTKNFRQITEWKPYGLGDVPTETIINLKNPDISSKQIKNYYYFLASVTNKEWSYDKLHKDGLFGDTTLYLITSQHRIGDVTNHGMAENYVKKEGYTWLETGHSHPLGFLMKDSHYDASSRPSGFNPNGTIKPNEEGDRSVFESNKDIMPESAWIFIPTQNRPNIIKYNNERFWTPNQREDRVHR
ncbi:RHS repeat-associated core domain-containing protein [Chryseobacterium sp. GP-SGM7]|uniref:RHS repeat-associated core domain-containing protein n=1 Tax=Chryseobacterium sp. GP-SGM7 TaxID=3411323 RepID=UPI003B9256E6